MSNLFFVALMIGASALGFVRTLLAGLLLSQDQFGLYTAVIGAVALAGMMVSFGIVEATTKLYPRLWVAGRIELIWQDATRIALRQGVVIAALAAGGAVLAQAGVLNVAVWLVALLGLFVWFQVLMAISAAILRAVGSVALLQTFATVRGAIPLVLVGAVLHHHDWEVAVIAETGAAGLIAAAGLTIVHRRKSRTPQARGGGSADDKLPRRSNADGRTLYFANLCSSSIALGDRALVAALLGPAAGGAYSVIALLVQSGALLTGILSQKIGPEIIRAIHQGDSIQVTLERLRFPVMVLAHVAALALALLIGGQVVSAALADFLGERGIGVAALGLGAVLFVLQGFMVVEFVLIAADNEGVLLAASMAALVVCAAGFAVSYGLTLPLEAYIASGVAARLAQIGVLSRGIYRAVARPVPE